MKETLFAILTGFIVGVIFQLLKLPTPAPQVFSGITGIFGIYLGAKSVPLIQKYVVLLMERFH